MKTKMKLSLNTAISKDISDFKIPKYFKSLQLTVPYALEYIILNMKHFLNMINGDI